MKITSIKRVMKKCNVYDITVKSEDHSFVVSDCVVHNCQICSSYEIQSSDKPFKGNEIPQIPHLSCRCVVVPVMKNDDFNQKFKRASMGGEVDGDTTYKTWFENQTEKVQRDILGTGKYNLWKNNEKVDITSFVSGGKVLTLKELQSLYD